MNSFLFLKVEGYRSSKIIKKLTGINVSIFDLKEIDSIVYVKILKKDYEKVQKYLKTIEFQKIKYSGPEYIMHTIKRYRFFVIAICLSIFMIVLVSNIIVDIDVIHEDEQLVELVKEELEKNGIKKFRLRKSYSSIQKIKSEIKNQNLDKIDWLEINKVGMKYVVRIEERIINKDTKEKDYCHLYSSKDALVTKIKVFNGEAIVNINDYVKKGDLLVSGDIKLNDEIVNQVCASGNVYAEVWYKVNIKIPFEYYDLKKTGKSRKNFIINYDGVDHQLFKDRIKTYEEKRKLVFDLLGIKIYLKTEEEVIKHKAKYTEEEALSQAMKLAFEKVSLKLKSTDKILSQKILQKRVIDSTMDVDIFIVAEEEVSSQVAARKETENGL